MDPQVFTNNQLISQAKPRQVPNIIIPDNRSTKALTCYHYREVCSHVCIVVWAYKNKFCRSDDQIDNAIEASEFAVRLLENVYKHYVILDFNKAQIISEFEKTKDILFNSNQLVSEYDSSDLYLHMWLVTHELDLVERAYNRHYGSYDKERGFIKIANLIRACFDKLRVSSRYY